MRGARPECLGMNICCSFGVHAVMRSGEPPHSSLNKLGLKGPLYLFLRTGEWHSRSEIRGWSLDPQTRINSFCRLEGLFAVQDVGLPSAPLPGEWFAVCVWTLRVWCVGLLFFVAVFLALLLLGGLLTGNPITGGPIKRERERER